MAKSVSQGSAKSKSTAKPHKLTAAKSISLSQEFVVDSDDESAAPNAAARKGIKQTSKGKQLAVSKPEPRASKSPSAAPLDDEDDDGEEESDSEAQSVNKPRDESPTLKRPDRVPFHINGAKRKASGQSTSGEDSQDIDSDSSLGAPVAKRAKSKDAAGRRGTSQGDQVEMEKHDKNLDERSPEDDSRTKAASGTTSEVTPIPTNGASVRRAIPVQPFKPPPGYVPVKVQSSSPDGAFSASALAGKELWHITAPTDVALSSITDVALDAIQTGATMFTRRGTDYALKEDTSGATAGSISILLPGKDGYVTAKQKIGKTLHLQQKVTLPDLSARQASQTTGSSAAANVALASLSTVRPQPKGLRMRYKPPGFGSGVLGTIGSDTDSADGDVQQSQNESAFQFPRALGGHSLSNGQVNDSQITDRENPLPVSKSRKKHKDKRHTDGNEVSEAHSGVADTRHEQGSGASVAALPATDTVTLLPTLDDTVHGDETATPILTKEEKAKRKEEKRLKRERKEAKARARASI